MTERNKEQSRKKGKKKESEREREVMETNAKKQEGEDIKVTRA